MQPADLIADYVAALSRELRFDPSLSRRVCVEVEDHLREAAADGTGADAENEAVARFGSPYAIARHFAAPSLIRQARSVGYAMVLVVLCSYLAMAGRVAWYVALDWRVGDDAPLAAFRAVTVLVDRYAFALAAIIGLCSLAYAWRARSAELSATCRSRLRRFILLCALAALGLLVTVAADIVLTALRLAGSAPSLASLLPLALLAVEIALTAIFIAYLRSVMRRIASAFALFPE
jgi:uncharacterized membrane protein